MVGFQPMCANIESCFAALTVAMLVPVAWLVVELSAPDGINPTSVATNVTYKHIAFPYFHESRCKRTWHENA